MKALEWLKIGLHAVIGGYKASYAWFLRSMSRCGEYLKYWYRYVKFWGRYRASYIYARAHAFRVHLGLVIYGTVIVTASLYLSTLVASVLQHDAVTFFTSAGAMFGGIIAIFFSVSTILMQSAAQSTSAGFYKLLGRDKWQEIIYWVISCFAIASFFLALVFSGPHASEDAILILWSSRAAIFVIGLTFLLLFVLYFRIYERINPRSSIGFVKRYVTGYMQKLARAAKQTSELMTANPNFDQKNTSIAVAAGLRLVKGNMTPVSDSLDHLFDYHNKLVKSEERKSARIVIDTITNILKEYFQIVSGGSLLFPSPEYFLTVRSDSEKFLTPHLQALVSAGIEYMHTKDDVGTSHVVWRMCDLVLAASEIKYVSRRTSENPIFSQCLGYLTQLADAAVQQESVEGAFQVAQTYVHIAEKAIQHGLHIELRTLYTSLNKIAFYSLVKKQPIVWQQVATTYGEIIRKLVVSGDEPEHIDVKGILESYEEIVMWAITAGKAEASFNDIFFRTKMEEMFQLIPGLAGHIASKVNFSERRGSATPFFDFIEEYRRMLRRMSEKMQSADHFLLRVIGDSIRDIGLLLLEILSDEKWKSEHAEVRNHLSWFVHQPGWFIHHAKGTISSNSSYDALVNAVAKIGIQAIEGKEFEIVDKVRKSLVKMANEMLERETPPKYGYTEPRIMEKVCYLGILALKLKNGDLLKLITADIKLFEEAYKKKYFSNIPEGIELTSPKEDQLRTELLGLRDKIIKSSYRSEYSMEGILDLPEDWMVQRIDLRDFDSFTLEVWKFFITPSPLDEELGTDKGSNP